MRPIVFMRLLSVALFVVGAVGFFAPFWLGLVKEAESVELPLVEVRDVAIANDNRVYFAIAHLGRVQVYAGDGTFARNFEIRNAGGLFCLDIAEDRLTVAVARRDAADTFDLDGKLISSGTSITREQYEKVCRPDQRTRSYDWTLGAVTLAFADGNRLVLSREPWHYLALGPFGSWLMAAVGILINILLDRGHGILDRIMGRSAK